MGCGSSSLKGEAPQGLNNDAAVDNRPIRKVATNFTTVDYEQEHNQERRNTAYAPHEIERAPSATSDAIRHANNGITPKDEGPKDGEQLKPYQSIDAGNTFTGNGDGDGEYPKPYKSISAGNTLTSDAIASNADPTSTTAKENFASDGNKSPWHSKNIKEEDLIKYTGKSKDDVLGMVDRGDGVGRGQPADSRYTPSDPAVF
ncbi:hypothetical protein DV736_g2903, partial [Chaetothyriales sp. CBS 134916]